MWKTAENRIARATPFFHFYFSFSSLRLATHRKKGKSRCRIFVEFREISEKNVKTTKGGLFGHGWRRTVLFEGVQGARWLPGAVINSSIYSKLNLTSKKEPDNEKDMEAKKAKMDAMLNDDSLPDELPQAMVLKKYLFFFKFWNFKKSIKKSSPWAKAFPKPMPPVSSRPKRRRLKSVKRKKKRKRKRWKLCQNRKRKRRKKRPMQN